MRKIMKKMRKEKGLEKRSLKTRERWRQSLLEKGERPEDRLEIDEHWTVSEKKMWRHGNLHTDNCRYMKRIRKK